MAWLYWARKLVGDISYMVHKARNELPIPMVESFWRPKPKLPFKDIRSWSLLLPAIASAIGFFAFAVLAFSFTELDLLPSWIRTGLVIVGAIALATGGEVGTLTTTIEIFRKYRVEETVWFDWAGLVISLCATLAEFILAFATLLGVKAGWSLPMQLYGPIGLGVLSALDSYVTFSEYGLFLSTFDKRMGAWQTDYEDWLLAQSKDNTIINYREIADKTGKTVSEVVEILNAAN